MTLPHGPAQLAFVAFALVFAGIVKGATGLGYATTALPLIALALGLKEAIPLVIAPSVASCVAVMVEAGPLAPALRRFWPMLAPVPFAVAAGAALLGRVASETAGAVLGVALLAWCAFSLARPGWRLPLTIERPAAPVVGALTGLVNGLTGSQVLPVVPFLMALDLPRAVLLQAMNLSFVLGSAAMTASLAVLGLMTFDVGLVSLAGVALALLGVRAGAMVRRRLPERAFRLAVLMTLAGTGAALVSRGM